MPIVAAELIFDETKQYAAIVGLNDLLALHCDLVAILRMRIALVTSSLLVSVSNTRQWLSGIYQIVRRAPNAKPVHQTAKRVGVNVENGARATRSTNQPAGSLEHSENMLAFYFFERIRRLPVGRNSGLTTPA